MHSAHTTLLAGAAVALMLIPAIAAPRLASPATETHRPSEVLLLNLPDNPFNYADVALPDHYLVNRFPPEHAHQVAAIDTDNTPPDNPTTDAGATLGRVLFYDTNLSSDGSVSCASCHIAEDGFSQSTSGSPGVGGNTRRHSMPITNARFNASGHFFWDERAATLEDQALMPFVDPIEMGLTLESLVEIVESQTYYPELFADAFGDAAVTPDRIAKALAQFMRAMVSYNSKYDAGAAQVFSPLDPFPNFTDQENLGKELFLTPLGGINCAECHVSEAFVLTGHTPPGSTTSAINIGLDATSTTDLGVAETTLNPADEGKFRVPSLRNIEHTRSYMHNASRHSLASVVEHYNSRIQPHPNLSPILKNPDGTPIRPNLTDQQQAALVAFLRTLSDTEMLTAEKFSNPFAEPCSPSDIGYPIGVLNLDDITAFADAFIAGDLAADCEDDEILNFDDIDCFVMYFLNGCG